MGLFPDSLVAFATSFSAGFLTCFVGASFVGAWVWSRHFSSAAGPGEADWAESGARNHSQRKLEQARLRGIAESVPG